jgi:hypothetical protein
MGLSKPALAGIFFVEHDDGSDVPEGDSALWRDSDCVGQKRWDFTAALKCRLLFCRHVCELRNFSQILKHKSKDKNEERK